MKKIGKSHGITLVALVITIVILIILATITINFAFGEEGLIQKALEAKNLTEQAVKDESKALNILLNEYMNIINDDSLNPDESDPGDTQEPENPDPGDSEEPEEPPKSEIEQAKGDEPVEDNTPLKDDLDNEVVIPGGFEIADDSGTKVEEGIVIQDSNGNQFVWIPVGEYKTSSGTKTNTLNRRSFYSSGSDLYEDEAIAVNYYGEGNRNSVAKDQIEAFKSSAKTNGGFYIGRYEQGVGNVCVSGVVPYANISRDTAKSRAEAFYTNNEFVESELMSSYAWDTALNFICQINGYEMADVSGATYGNMNTDRKTNTGEYEADNYCNIHDFLGNCQEWTTEYYAGSAGYPYVLRGGAYDSNRSASNRTFFDREYGISYDEGVSFRLQIYLI